MDDPLEKMKAHMLDVEKTVRKDSVSVPFEVWRMTNDIVMNNVEHLYAKIRELEADRGFDMDFRIGEIEIHLGGPASSQKEIIEHGEHIIKSITDTMRTFGESIEKIADANKVKKNEEANRGFA